ncbi:uncharacterized protein ATNIH1004_009273 [Aspergillus tanneri]|uniref:Uncharacterized protein n=1 Tax=Aspergillus tanneri TaxID=1220188 RepID=A0A5M9MDK3_9EURO|nr:uncharacterized protein ATNIH1004_009273 [Aspergillus tanneri]KAA8645062.1 hypothetical protein ATNIH1004_009273 [Aspergillus tanneri]
MSAQNPADAINTWALVRHLFSREQHHLQHIEKLEQSLSNAGRRNHEERSSYNSLHRLYDKLYRAHTALSAENQRLKHELAVLQCHHCHEQHQTPNIEGARVEELK